jgi:pimeloyl-ACP methyl ester carboxylesterase
MSTADDALFDGIVERVIDTPRLTVNILERTGDDPGTPAERTVVLVHGNVSSSLFWQEIMQDLPSDLRVIAVDLRGFGGTEHAPIDATRGVRDFSDDVHATLETLGIEAPHLVGWSMGGGVVMQYALDHPVASLTLQSPVSPYGFGGTRRDGSRLTDDDAGAGGGGGNPDFVQRLTDGDTTDAEATSPRSVFRSGYVAPGYTTEHEDVWVASMLTTSTATGNYPGDGVASENWPGFAAGTTGVLNTMVPKYFDTSAIVDLDPKPPILWIHGTADAIVSDASFYDLNQLGKLGVIPGWPGDDVAPAQPMVSQTRDVLDAYRAGGGQVTERELEGVGHSPHLERPAEFRQALLTNIGYVGRPQHPAPPTEAIILKSED